MTRAELAEILGISLRTLSNWEKEKPTLVKLINQGLSIDEQIEEVKKNLKKLEELKESANCGKFKLK